MILKSFEFKCDFDLDFQITTSKMIWILILNHLYLSDLILILKSSTYDDFAHLCIYSVGLGHFGRGHLGRGHYSRSHLGRGHYGRGHFGRGHLGRGHFGPLIQRILYS